ncbi:DUF3243 domain-containing protein [Ferroacidibacillus organovorans]|nr:DUF3243 domain-containing protein [Ferroacidibacillus organovorans]
MDMQMGQGMNPESYIDDFSKWKEWLGDRVNQAHAVGMSDQQLEEAAVRMGSYLAEKVDPANPQERLLAQMWNVSPKEDQRVLARTMINLVSKDQQTRH